MHYSSVYTYRFDFDIGYLIKSPCRDCERRKQLPDCIEACSDIDRLQSRLAGSISLAAGGGNLEACAVESRGWEGK